jgi:hypothetical protein
VVDAPALRRAAWIAAAVLAAGVMIALAVYGRRPDPSLARFEAAGVMLFVPPDNVTEVVVSRGERRWRFERTSDKGWAAPPGPTPGESVRAHLDRGLRFLHVSAPQRVLQPEEVAGTPPSEFGLAPPRFSVSVRSPAAAPFDIEFGALNPQGLAQYARITGRAEILLLPSFIGEQWEAVMDAR